MSSFFGLQTLFRFNAPQHLWSIFFLVESFFVEMRGLTTDRNSPKAWRLKEVLTEEAGRRTGGIFNTKKVSWRFWKKKTLRFMN